MADSTETDLLMAADIMNELLIIDCDQNTNSVIHTEDIDVRNIAESILNFFKNLLYNTDGNIDNISLHLGSSFLANLTSNPTGNSLSEVYIRVRRLLFHHCRDIKTVFPTWFKPTDLNELAKQVDGVLTFEEDLIYGLEFPLERIHVSFSWCEFMITMWKYCTRPILSINDFRRMNISTIQTKLIQLLYLSSINPNITISNEITKVTPKKNLRKWWALVQVVFNCPLDNLWWYPGISILRWLREYRQWEVGYLQPRPELRPVTIQNMANNIMAVWQYAGWLDITKAERASL